VNRCSLTGGDGARDPISSIPVFAGYGKWTVNFSCGRGGIAIFRQDHAVPGVDIPSGSGSPAPPRGQAAGPIIRIEAQAREEIVPSCRAPFVDQAAKDYATTVVTATFELTGVTRFST
jgi:hypothetical protein